MLLWRNMENCSKIILVTILTGGCSNEGSQWCVLWRYVETCPKISLLPGAGRVVWWCWINFQCLGVLLIWIRVGQGPTALAVGAGGGCLNIFSLRFFLSSFSLRETARYRLKYCLKGPLSPKTANYPCYLSIISMLQIRRSNAGPRSAIGRAPDS